MGENGHSPLGPADAPGDGRSQGAAVRDEPVEAYEEDWYRSLRALAERRQQLGESFAPPTEGGELPSEERSDVVGEGAAEAPVASEGSSVSLEPGGPGVVQASPADTLAVGTDDPADVEPTHGTDGPVALAGEPRSHPPAAEAEDATTPSNGDPGRAIGELERVDGDGAVAGVAEQRVRPGASDHEPSAVDTALRGVAARELGTLAAEEPEDGGPVEPTEPWVTTEELEAEGPAGSETGAEPAVPSLASTDPEERRRALQRLAGQELSDADAERIATLLFDPDAGIRLEALQALGRRPERLEDATLAQALQDPSDDVRALAVELAVRRGPQVLEALVALLPARDRPLTHRTVLDHLPEVVASSEVDGDALGRILEAVGRMDPGPSEEERPAMSRLAHALGIHRVLGCLDSPDVRRLGAVRLLADDRSPVVLRTLASVGGDPLEEVRHVAAAAIAMLGQTRGEPPTSSPAPDPKDAEEEAERIASLARALHDEDGTVRHLALSGLAGMDRAAIVAWVHETIRGGDPSQLALAASTAKVLRLIEGAADILDAAAELPADARHNLVEALRSFVMPPDQLAGLLAQVREPVRAEAIRMLWRVGGPPLLPHLRAHLDDPSEQVRVAVLEAFGDSGDPAAVEVASTVLDVDASAHVRGRAVRVLADAGSPPVSAVVRALSDPDPEVRAIAIGSFPDMGDPEAVDVLVSSLSDPDDRVRKAAAGRLASRGDDPELVWSALQMAPEIGRAEIIGAFERARPGSLTQVALRRLPSPDEEERVLAVEIAGWGGSPGCVEGAIQALQDPAAPVRRAAAEALGRLREPAAAKALGKALGDPDPQVRVGVVRALGVIDDEGVLGFLVSALNDPDPRVREVTSQVLTEWSSPAVAKRLAGVLAVPSLRDAATDLLTRIGPPAVELLIEVLMQHNPAVAPTVGRLLERIAEPEEFVSRLEAVEPERRLRGLEALGAIGGPEAADALVRAIADPDERIRVRAAQLVADLRDPRARQVLDSLTRDPVPGVVAAAQEALSRLGADGDRAA